MNTEFTTKEEYLAFRTEWRKDYAELTLKQREAKREAGLYDRATSKQDVEVRKALQKKYAFKYLQYDWNEVKWHVSRNKLLANVMLDVRKASKIRSQEQYLKAKEKEAN